MRNLYDNAAIRAIERTAFLREDSFAVMRRAGTAVAKQAQAMLKTGDCRPLLAIAGPGNNGGDALIAAAQLRAAGIETHVVAVGNSNRPAADAQQALAAWRDNGGQVFREPPAADYALVLDGLLGIGLARTVEDSLAEMIRRLHNWRTLAIDVPSGIDSNTGARRGEAISAARTVTFFAAKPGLYTGDGASAAGQVAVETLGFEDFPAASGVLLDNACGLNLPRLRRDKNSHKGTHGSALIIGGADGLSGALILAARAAVRLGAGKVYAVSVATQPPQLDWQTPEIMWRAAANPPFAEVNCLAIGPGLGLAQAALLAAAIDAPLPLIADADALNMLAADKTLAARVARRNDSTIITPHPGEAAKLLNCDIAVIHNDRLAAAQQLAAELAAIVVLKGAGSVIAAPDKTWAICPAGNPGLAQAGAGDILTGIIAALLAQTGDALFAARAGVWLHGAAADELAAESGEIGLNLNALAGVAARLLNNNL